MDILYVKYNRDRSPEYQISTTIYAHEGKMYVRKRALTPLAYKHIENIYNNYLVLRKEYKSIDVAKADINFDEVTLEYINGNTFNDLLVNSLKRKDKTEFFSIFGEYVEALKSISEKQPFINENYAMANEILGDEIDGFIREDYQIRDVDLNLDNLIKNENGKLINIDYEWVLPFPIPLKYVIYRSVLAFATKNKELMNGIIFTDDIYKFCEISDFELSLYKSIEIRLWDRIYKNGNWNLYLKDHANLPVNIIDIYNTYYSVAKTKVYIDAGNGYSEERSVSRSINFNSVEFSFSFNLVSMREEIQTIRWDPIEARICRVKINQIIYIDNNGVETNLSQNDISSNGKLSEDNFYTFDSLDPIFYFNIKGFISRIIIAGEWYFTEYNELVETVNRLDKSNNQLHKDVMSSQCLINKIETEVIDLQNDLLSCKEAADIKLRDCIEVKDLRENELVKLQDDYNKLQAYLMASLEHIKKQEEILLKKSIKYHLKKLIPISALPNLKKLYYMFKILVENPAYIRKGLRELRKNGLNSLNRKISSKAISSDLTGNYTEILGKEASSDLTYKDLSFRPRISVVMPVYNVDPIWLDLAVNSVLMQNYENWELCIVDDCSTNEDTIKFLKDIKHEKIIVKFSEVNGGISKATNCGVSIATGEYIALLDNDDELRENALFEVALAINEWEPDVLYSDEDKIDSKGMRRFPFYKPNWNPDLLRSQMYICHLLVFKKQLFNSIGGFRSEYDGSQDYDLMLRLSEKTNKIHHIPKILYSWRELETSTAFNPESKPYAHNAGLNALNEHLERVFGEGKAYARETENLFVYDARYIMDGEPMVSIMIPTKDKIDLLDNCIKSILEKTKYSNFEIIILDNNSVEKQTFEWFEKITASNRKIKIIDAKYDFNWSKLNNHGMKDAKGDVFVFLNNDTIVISEDWLTRLAEKALRDDVGTVGGLLLYPDNTIQHAGVVVGFGGWADHVFKGMAPIHFGSPFVSPVITRNVTASTGACLAIAKSKIDRIGLFDENFIICGSDIELSIRALNNGLINIYDPYVRLYHLESKTRSPHIPEVDFELSYALYEPYRKNGDPYYNINLSIKSLIPKIRGCEEN